MKFSKGLNLLLLLMFVAFASLPHQSANIQLAVYFSLRSLLGDSDRKLAKNHQSKSNQGI